MFRDSDWRTGSNSGGYESEGRYSRDLYPFGSSSYERDSSLLSDYGRDYGSHDPSYGRDYDSAYHTSMPPAGRRPGLLDAYPSRGPPPPPLGAPHCLASFLETESGSFLRGEVLLIPPLSHLPKPTLRDKPPGCKTIFIGGIPDLTEEIHMKDIFMDYGNILSIRLSKSGKKFCHIRFDNEDAVDKAVEISGYRMRIGPTNGSADISRIHVDYSQNKNDQEEYAEKQNRKMGNMPFNAGNVSAISADLHKPDTFEEACRNTISWFEKGNCGPQNSISFFGMLSTVNTQAKQLSKDISQTEIELGERVNAWTPLLERAETIEKVYQSSHNKRAYDSFTKPQRKMISQWEDFTENLKKQIREKIERETNVGVAPKVEDEQEPLAKKLKEEDAQLRADLEKARDELEKKQRKHDTEIEARDKQIYQLKSLMAHFKKEYPAQWSTVVKAKERNVKKEESTDVVEGVELGDLKEMMQTNTDSTNPLAAAAAEYAKTRNTVAEKATELGMTEKEIAMVTVIATFLAVHPLGATIAEITHYFQAFNPQSSGYYLQGLLTRLPQVFQMTQSAEELEPRWWFLGYQSTSQTAAAVYAQEESEEDQITVEMTD